MKVTWISPSNIALIKYWGKYGNQFPCNPSISFTLKNSYTQMSIELKKSSEGYRSSFLFENQESDKFKLKIDQFILSQKDKFPWINHFLFNIESKNTFPHSAGIASSASSMSALCLCLLSLDELITSYKLSPEEFLKKASSLSRQASGSACRSIFPGVVSWGDNKIFDHGTNEHASKLESVNRIFSDFCDSILIVDSSEKSVSSRAGHSLMNGHPFAEARYSQANSNFEDLVTNIQTGDTESFIRIVENEALTLHGLMMSSNPSYLLLKPQSLLIIEKIREQRNKLKLPMCFTIDAGPNIHLLYPSAIKEIIRPWIEEELSNYLVGIKYIHDEVGNGPVKISESLN